MATENYASSIFLQRIPLPPPTSSAQPRSPLRQELGLFHLVMTGLAGTTIVILTTGGLLVGQVAGTGAFLCFLLAGLVSLFPGACFIEFATRMPSAGSVYSYTYATVGEAVAFLVGWNNFCDLVVQAAMACKSIAALLDRLTGGAIRRFSLSLIGRQPAAAAPLLRNATAPAGHLFERSPDLVAVALLAAICVVLVLSVDLSVTCFNIMASLFLLCFLVIVGCCFAFGATANLVSTTVPFLEHGLGGLLRGASIIIFAFMLYDAISVASEEARRPQDDVPRAAFISFSVTLGCLVLSSLAIAFLVPHRAIDITAPFFSGFQRLGLGWAAWFTVGVSVLALATACLSTMYCSSRYLYAIARDGLLPSPLAFLHPTFQTPVGALVAGTSFSVFLALLFDLVALTEMSQFGSVLSFFMIGIDLLVVRYLPLGTDLGPGGVRPRLRLRSCLERLLGPKAEDKDGEGAWMHRPIFFAVLLMTEVFCIFFSAIVFSACISIRDQPVLWASGVLFVGVGLLAFFVMCAYAPNPAPGEGHAFSVPLLPLVPVMAITLSLGMAANLPAKAWLRFIVLSLIGYFAYLVQRLTSRRYTKVREFDSDDELEVEAAPPDVNEDDDADDDSSSLFSDSTAPSTRYIIAREPR